MDSDLNILVVSHAFPPAGPVGSLRVARFCQYLPHRGIHPIVLTVEDRYHEHLDGSVLPPPGIRIEKTGLVPTPLNLYRRWAARRKQLTPHADNSQGFPKSKPLDSMRTSLLLCLKTPEPEWDWYWPAVRAAKKLMARENIAAIFSSAPPWTSHLVARELKKRFGVPWVADFRDPWVRPADQDDQPQWRRRLLQRLEANCVHRADRVICNTDALRAFLAERYPDVDPERFLTLTNGFDDPAVPPAAISAVKQTRVALHTGEIYGRRRIDGFCNAIDMLVRQGRLCPDTLRIVFLGRIDSHLAESARRRAPQLFESELVEFQHQIPWQEAQQAIWGADLLLLFQGDYSLQVPAKLYEYLPTGKPIFAVAKKGATTDLLESTQTGLWADPDDPEQIARKFLGALQISGCSPQEARLRLSKQYHYRSLAEKLANWIHELAYSRMTKNGDPSN